MTEVSHIGYIDCQPAPLRLTIMESTRASYSWPFTWRGREPIAAQLLGVVFLGPAVKDNVVLGVNFNPKG